MWIAVKETWWEIKLYDNKNKREYEKNLED